MKTIFSVIGIIGIGVLIWLLVWSIQMGQAFSWKPPSTELKLNQGELEWENSVKRDYNCEVDYIGLDGGFQEDSIIYINISFKDNSKLKEILNDSIEFYTEKLSTSFILNSKRKQKYILFSYHHIHNFNLDTVIKKFPLTRSCLFDIKKNKVFPTEKHLIFTKYHYLKLDTTLNAMSFSYIGNHKYDYIKNYGNEQITKKKYLIKNFTFKGIENCQSYQEIDYSRTENNEFSIDYKFNYNFFDDVCISTLINYKIYPKSKKYHYKNLVQYLTNIDYQKNEKTIKFNSVALNYINPNYLNYEAKTYGVLIKSKADTTKIPWTIYYETSLDKIETYSDMK